MTYNEYQKHKHAYKAHGIQQFLTLYRAHKDCQKKRADLKWGEEIEYSVFHFDEATKTLKLSNEGFRLIQEINDMEEEQKEMLGQGGEADEEGEYRGARHGHASEVPSGDLPRRVVDS